MGTTTLQNPAEKTSFKEQFYKDITNGLLSEPRHLDSKYFYDAEGDKLFQEIMKCDEYYLTNCEMEIFTSQTAAIASQLRGDGSPFDLIELGAGDATKSIHLLRQLQSDGIEFTYVPVDISGNVIAELNASLPKLLPGLKIEGLEGEYFEMLKKAAELSPRRKVVLFMGSNIGNMTTARAASFTASLRRYLSTGDIAVIGFDLKKDPQTIRAAYDDSEGITSRFNLNLLKRINNELGADFNLDKFKHYASYDPETGSCKSYLISSEKQEVHMPGIPVLQFEKDEYIHMEISQKYTIDEVTELATRSGFDVMQNFLDSKNWFLDTVWRARQLDVGDKL